MGIGEALFHHDRRLAIDDLRLEELRLEARGGMELEDYYLRLGWAEVGRHPRALRLNPDEDQDEVVMIFELDGARSASER